MSIAIQQWVEDLITVIKSRSWVGVLVVGCDGDPLIDRQVELVEMLKKRGVQVEAQFSEGDYHGVELIDATKADSLFVFLKHFIEKILG